MMNKSNILIFNTFKFLHMKSNKFLSMLLLALAVFTYSCSSDDDGTLDSEAPVVVINEPHLEEAFMPGEEIHIDIDATDNVALASYKIDIHWAGDDHSHRPSTMSDDDHDHYAEWDFEVTGDLNSTEDHIHMHVDIPIEFMHEGEMKLIKEGEYHFGVIVIDQAGNETSAFRDIFIGDDHGHDHD